MFKVIDNMLIAGLTTVRLFVLCLSVIIVVTVWMRTRSFGPTAAAVLFGAFVVFGAFSTKYMADLVYDTVDESKTDVPSTDVNGGDIDLPLGGGE